MRSTLRLITSRISVRIKRLVDVIVRAQPQGLLRGLQRAETGEHDDGNVRIDFADPAQTIDAISARHANVGDHRVGMFFLQQPNAGLDGVRRVHLIVRLQEHAQTLARTDLVVDDEDFRLIGTERHYHARDPARAKVMPPTHFEPNSCFRIACARKCSKCRQDATCE